MLNTLKNIFVHIYSLHLCLDAFSTLNWPALSKKIRFTKKTVGFSLVLPSFSSFADDYTRCWRSRDDASVVVVHSCFKSLINNSKRETHFFLDERAAKKWNNFFF